MRPTSQLFTARRHRFIRAAKITIVVSSFCVSGCSVRTLTGVSSPGGATQSSGTSSAPLTVTPEQTSVRAGQADPMTASSPGGIWSVEGGASNGRIDSSGNYLAPIQLPADTTVAVDYRLNQQIVSTSISLLNPWPTLAGVSPDVLTTASTTVTASGSGFVPSSQLLLNNKPLATTYVDASHLTAVVTITDSPPTQLNLTVSNPDPGASVSSPLSLKVSLRAFQVLPGSLAGGTIIIQATLPNFPQHTHLAVNGQAFTTFLDNVTPNSISAWGYLDPWLTGTATVSIVSDYDGSVYSSIQVPIAPTAVSFDAAARFATQAAFGPRLELVQHIQNVGIAAFVNEQLAQPPVTQLDPNDSLRFLFNQAVDGNSLLRLRVALGLETFIPGNVWVNDYGQGIPWEAKLEADAFGNYRQILLDALADPNVAGLLTLPGNVASTDPNVHPNQNFAREIMQQFSMGSNRLNDDGTLALDANGNPIPNYDENTIMDASRMLTGWNYANPSNPNFTWWGIDFSKPLVANESLHDTGTKTLFGTVDVPAGQTAEQDRESFVDAIMSQQSTAPFVSRILIQRLVKSNPTPDYVKRITQVFRDDGQGVSGDMAAVVKAILLDPEAREGDTTPRPDDGMLQDPLLFQLFVQNAIRLSNTDDQPIYLPKELGENVWEAGSVFGYYRPGFMIPGTQINSPEFQVFTTPQVIGRSGALMWLLDAYNPNGTSELEHQFATLPQLIDALNHIVYHGTMPQYEQDAIQSYCAPIQDPHQRFIAAAFIALNSDNFSVNR